MTFNVQLVIYVLTGLDVALYASLIFAYLRPKLIRVPKVSEATIAFGVLEDALQRSFPSLPDGFTWTEGIIRAKSLRIPIKWEEVEGKLRQYEAFRYGEMDPVEGDLREVMKLAYSLPRRSKYDHRSQR